MSLLKTKPNWFRGEIIATEQGWVNPQNNEVLVSVGNLKSKLALELAETTPKVEVVKVESPKVMVEEPKIEIIKVKEIKMDAQEKQKKSVATKKTRVIGEVTEAKVPAGKQIIAEVVEYDLDKPVIGE